MQLTVVTWNVKGSSGVDTALAARHLRETGADLVALQEVQRHQARRIAKALDAASLHWSFKHWPVVTWPEGMAVIGVTRAVTARGRPLSHRWRPWSWRRRIVVDATLPVDGGRVLRLLDLHLTPDTGSGRREIEVGLVLDGLVSNHDGPVIVAGDLNDRPTGPVSDLLEARGLRDAWLASGGDPDGGFTNWHGWEPGTTELPAQRLDYVWVSTGIGVGSASVPAPGDDGFATFASLSDHLPFSVTVDVAHG